MTTSSKVLYQGLLPTSDTILYSPGSGIDAYVDSVTVKNVTGSSANLTLSIVRGGAAISTASEQFDAHPIVAGTKPEQLTSLVNGRLSSSDALRGFSGTSSALSLTVYGREVS